MIEAQVTGTVTEIIEMGTSPCGIPRLGFKVDAAVTGAPPLVVELTALGRDADFLYRYAPVGSRVYVRCDVHPDGAMVSLSVKAVARIQGVPGHKLHRDASEPEEGAF